MLKIRYRSKFLFICQVVLVQALMMNGSISQVICRDTDGVRLEKADILSHCHCHNQHNSLVLERGNVVQSPIENTWLETEGGTDCRDLAIIESMHHSQFIPSSDPDYNSSRLPRTLGPLFSLPRPGPLYMPTIGESPPRSGPSLFVSFSIWRC